MDDHNIAVRGISASIVKFYDRQQPFQVYHGSTSRTLRSHHSCHNVVDMSNLVNILKINPERKTALVESNVPMDRLVEATLKRGLIPPIVMELPGFTVGGGFSSNLEASSSFKYGLFNKTINWIEIIQADGDIVIASESERPDLFYGAAGTLDTLGVVTLLEIRLVWSRCYVELTYHPISSSTNAVDKFCEVIANNKYDYVDGIMFSKHQGVVMVGRRTNTPRQDSPIQKFRRARDPWFYLHAHEQLERSTGSTTVAIPLLDYLFRYDRGSFWSGRYAFKYFLVPFNCFTRFVLDPFMHSRILHHGLHESSYPAQDMAIPYRTTPPLVEYLDRNFGFYPLWLCPSRPDNETSTPLTTYSDLKDKDSIVLKIKAWGRRSKRHTDFILANRQLEQKLGELSGTKTMSGDIYCTEEEFWNPYDREHYMALRDKYHATHWPTVYEKLSGYGKQKREVKYSWVFWLVGLGAFCCLFRGMVYLIMRMT